MSGPGPAAPARIRVLEVNGWLKGLKTRIPFRFGAVNLVDCPHLCVEIRMEVDGEETAGIAADNLPPGWFDKTKGKPYPDQLREQLSAFRWASEAVLGRAGSGFALWRDAHDHAYAEGRKRGLPDLVLGFGASLVERALWDGLGRAMGLSFGELVRRNLFGIDWASLDPALRGVDPAAFLPERPLERIWARHTVGMADPLTEDEIAESDRVRDGLPQSLEACLAAYRYRFLKIKLRNDLDKDLDRLTRIGRLLSEAESRTGAKIFCTLDGNEQYESVSEIAEIARALRSDRALRPFDGRIVFLEQPLRREAALDPERAGGISDLPYPVIIDESDSAFESYPRAIALGYRGTSHKNCKGVIKSLVNKARSAVMGGDGWILSGEDLTNIGPIALQQDLHVAATLGIDHVERNGHHYFAGLDHVSEAVIDEVTRKHPGLYRRADGRATLAIDGGAVDCRGLVVPGLGGVLPRGEDWTPWNEYDLDAHGEAAR